MYDSRLHANSYDWQQPFRKVEFVYIISLSNATAPSGLLFPWLQIEVFFSVLNRSLSVEAKIAPNEVKEVRKVLFKLLFIVVKREISLKSELISFETKGKEICKHWGEREHRPYVFANLLFPKEK